MEFVKESPKRESPKRESPKRESGKRESSHKRKRSGSGRRFNKYGSLYDNPISEPLLNPIAKIVDKTASEKNKTLFFFVVYNGFIYFLNSVNTTTATTVLFNISCFYKTICKIIRVVSVNIIGSFDYQHMTILKYGIHIDQFPINRLLDAEKEKVERYIGNKTPKYELLTFNNNTNVKGTSFVSNGNVRFTVVGPNQGIFFENDTGMKHTTPQDSIGSLKKKSVVAYVAVPLPKERDIYRYMACLLDGIFDTEGLTPYIILPNAHAYNYGDSGIVRGNLNAKRANVFGGKTRKKRKTNRRY